MAGMNLQHPLPVCSAPIVGATIQSMVLVFVQERLLVERSGKTFLETGGVMSNLRAFSQSLMGQRLPQTQEARPR